MNKINIDGLAAEIDKELTNYNEELTQTLGQETLDIANEAAAELRQVSPKKTGKYAKSWTCKKTYQDKYNVRYVVYVKKPHYRLTHLLEYGHAKVNGGRTKALPHIKPVEDEYVAKYEKKIKEALG